MPYAPGVVDRSGEIMGQGIANAGENLAQGYQQFKQNQMLTNQAIGEFQAVASNPANQDILQKLANDPGAAGKAYGKLSSGKALAPADAALLSQYANTAQTVKQQQQMQQFQAAQIADFQSQARERAAKATQMEQMMRLLQGWAGQGAASPSGQGQPQAGQPAPVGAPSPMPSPGQAPNVPPPPQAQQADIMSPTAPPPTIEGVARSLMPTMAGATGQLPAPEVIQQAYTAARNEWASQSKPLGFVKGGISEENGQKVQAWYPITKTNGGSIIREKEPVKTYTDSPPPGRELDPTTFQPVSPQAAATPAAAPIPDQHLTTQAREALKTIEAENKLLTEQRAAINQAKMLNDNLNKRRESQLTSITGSPIGNFVEKTALGDPTGEQMDRGMAPLYNQIMSTAKNVRNVMEFNALTSSIPKSDMSKPTRDANIGALDRLNATTIAKNNMEAKLILSGVTPESAHAKVAEMNLDPDNGKPLGHDNKEVVHRIFNTMADYQKAVSDGDVSEGDTVTVAGQAYAVRKKTK